MDDDLDMILNARDIPPMRSHLEHKIIERAGCDVAVKPAYKGFWDIFLENLIVPYPAMAMVFVLLCGVVMSGYLENEIHDEDEVVSYFLSADDFDYGDLS